MKWNQRIPTVKSLQRLSNYRGVGGGKRSSLHVSDAKELRKLLEQVRGAGGQTDALALTNKFLDGSGVEDLYPDYPNIGYVNMGDTYDTTLIFDMRTGCLYVGAWGDYVENHPLKEQN